MKYVSLPMNDKPHHEEPEAENKDTSQKDQRSGNAYAVRKSREGRRPRWFNRLTPPIKILQARLLQTCYCGQNFILPPTIERFGPKNVFGQGIF